MGSTVYVRSKPTSIQWCRSSVNITTAARKNSIERGRLLRLRTGGIKHGGDVQSHLVAMMLPARSTA